MGESVEGAFIRGSAALTTQDILACIRDTHSLSEIMAEEIEKMTRLYEERKFKKASKE